MSRKSILLLACCLVVVGLSGCTGKEGPMGPQGPNGVTLVRQITGIASTGANVITPIAQLGNNNSNTFVHVYFATPTDFTNNDWEIMADGEPTVDRYYSVNWVTRTVTLYGMLNTDHYSIDVFEYN